MKLATVLVLLVGLAVSGGDYAATSNIRGDLTFPVERELSHRKVSSSSSSKSGSRSGSRSGGHRRCGYVILNPKGHDSRQCYRKLKKEIEEKLRVHVTDGSSSSCESSRSRNSHRGGWRNLRSGRKLNGSPSSSSSSSHKHHHSHSGSRSKSWTCYGRKVDEITIRSSDCKTSDDKKDIIDDIEDELYETYRDSRADYCARKGSSSSSSSESSSSTKSSSSSSESSSSSSDKKASSSSGSKASKSTERK
jgi:hypothetical protein